MASHEHSEYLPPTTMAPVAMTTLTHEHQQWPGAVALRTEALPPRPHNYQVWLSGSRIPTERFAWFNEGRQKPGG